MTKSHQVLKYCSFTKSEETLNEYERVLKKFRNVLASFKQDLEESHRAFNKILKYLDELWNIVRSL